MLVLIRPPYYPRVYELDNVVDDTEGIFAQTRAAKLLNNVTWLASWWVCKTEGLYVAARRRG